MAKTKTARVLESVKTGAAQTALDIMQGVSVAGRLAESQSFACITAPILSAILTNIQNGKHGRRRTCASQSEWDREQEIIDEAGGGELVFADTLVTYWDKICYHRSHVETSACSASISATMACCVARGGRGI